MSYHHFTISERITIQSYLKVEFSVTKIARLLGVHRSSVSREIRRNQTTRGYEGIEANSYYLERKKRCHKPIKLTPAIKQHIEERILERTWSPEQIVGRDEDKPVDFPSVSTIYSWVHKGYIVEGGIDRLRRKGKLTRTIAEKKRCRTDVGKTIRKRPQIVYKRQRIGDWEGDTVYGKHGTKSCFVTLLERKSRFYLADLLPSRQSDTVKTSIINLLSNIPSKYVKTITFDRGKEFSKWRDIEKGLKCKSYFTDPFCAWQKGSNENTNGLLREFFPKGTNLANVKPEDVRQALNLLNNRPRKCLGYKTPAEVFYSECCT